MNLNFTVPFAVRCTLLGGAAIGIINNEMYIEPVVLINPGIAAQVGIIYSLSDVLALLVKAQYLAVMDSGKFVDWYQEVSISAGIGIRLGK